MGQRLAEAWVRGPGTRPRGLPVPLPAWSRDPSWTPPRDPSLGDPTQGPLPGTPPWARVLSQGPLPGRPWAGTPPRPSPGTPPWAASWQVPSCLGDPSETPLRAQIVVKTRIWSEIALLGSPTAKTAQNPKKGSKTRKSPFWGTPQIPKCAPPKTGLAKSRKRYPKTFLAPGFFRFCLKKSDRGEHRPKPT